MSEETEETPEPEKKPEGKKKGGIARLVFLQDGVFSSVGVHNKGDKVEVPEAEAKLHVEKGLATRIDD